MPYPDLPSFCCILTCSLLLLPCAPLSQDGLILFKIKEEDWGGDPLSDWNESDQNPCGWTGITCDAFNSVTKVDLTNSFISGNLTSAICGLANLTVLILQYNAFSGPFPNGLLRCKRLRELDLSGNNFSGTLPSRIFELSELRKLNLGVNSFSGPIPPAALAMLPNLKVLHLDGNRFNGTFDVLQNLKSLVKFTIGFNPLLPGTVPRWLGHSRQLQELHLQDCNLVGEIPDIFGNLTELELLDMSQNHLQGNIPSSLMDLRSLRELRLNNNNLSGQIPSSIMDLSSLQALDLSHNDLSGQIPGNIHQLRNLTYLGLGENALTGRIPSELRWDSLISFNISSNNLSGFVPDELDREKYMEMVLPNPRLCGGQDLPLPPCSTPHKITRLAIILVAPLFIVVMALSSICLCRWSRRKPTETPSWKKTPFISTEMDESYILCNLKESNVIGTGSAGKVYKVILQTGQVVAVKKIQTRGKLLGLLH